MAKRIRNQAIRVKTAPIYGRLAGKKTFLVVNGVAIEGQTLYRLARAIVRRFENAVPTTR